nr:CFF_HP1_G0049330.mRNA.1.CDS.1 [Saccharomyces cerevisiae]
MLAVVVALVLESWYFSGRRTGPDVGDAGSGSRIIAGVIGTFSGSSVSVGVGTFSGSRNS